MMSAELLIFALCVVAIVTVLYKFAPYREAKGKKPAFALFPKYKKRVKWSSGDEKISEVLSLYGFELKGGAARTALYSRGSILGDFSIKLAKIDLLVTPKDSDEIEICISASWMALFDTGDHFQFLSELTDKISNA